MNGEFDLKTHKRDPKTGKVLDENLYRRIAWVEGAGAERTRHVVYERDGIYYTSDGVETARPECLDMHAARVAEIRAKQKAREDERRKRAQGEKSRPNPAA